MKPFHAALVCVLASGCQERVSTVALVALLHDEAGAAVQNSEHVVPPAACTGRCCPASCEAPRDGAAYSGPECLAQRDNTRAARWQLRQTMSVSTAPPGIANSQIANILVQRSELASTACGAPSGQGGFIQLIDFDRAAGTARVGFASYVKDQDSALRDGLCFAVDDHKIDSLWKLDRLYVPDWPKGLPPPMPQPWKVSVVNSVRLPKDFDLKSERETLLERLADGGDLAAYDGVFFLDETRGLMHGYAPLAFIVNYDTPKAYTAIPIRETELHIQVNDPDHPNCVGSFLGDNPNLPPSCEGNATDRNWGCHPGNCGAEELAPATVKGYFLVAEMEQVYILLGQTLCHLLPGGAVPGWSGNKSCREDAKFDPTDPLHGLPPGDFCAKTNDVATPDCHDAFRSVSYAAFQAFPIRDGTCPAL